MNTRLQSISNQMKKLADEQPDVRLHYVDAFTPSFDVETGHRSTCEMVNADDIEVCRCHIKHPSGWILAAQQVLHSIESSDLPVHQPAKVAATKAPARSIAEVLAEAVDANKATVGPESDAAKAKVGSAEWIKVHPTWKDKKGGDLTSRLAAAKAEVARLEG